MSRRRAHVLACVLLLANDGCVISRGVGVSRVGLTGIDSVTIEPPAKAHLVDGSIVVYRAPVKVSQRRLVGPGTRYGLVDTVAVAVSVVALDSVVSMETYRTQIDEDKTLAYSAGATLVTLVGVVIVLGVLVSSALSGGFGFGSK